MSGLPHVDLANAYVLEGDQELYYSTVHDSWVLRWEEAGESYSESVGEHVAAALVANDTRLREAQHPGSFRRFELTIGVYLPSGAELPKTFMDWIVRAFGVEPETLPATPSVLERVVEVRYPLAGDVIEKRAQKTGPWR